MTAGPTYLWFDCVLQAAVPRFLGAPCSPPSCTSRKILWELGKYLGVSYLGSQMGFLLCPRVTVACQAWPETSAVCTSLSLDFIGFSFSPLCFSRYCFLFHLLRNRVVFSVFSVKNRKIQVNCSKKTICLQSRHTWLFCKGNSCSDCSQQQRVPTEKLRTTLKANKKEIQNYCCCYSLF